MRLDLLQLARHLRRSPASAAAAILTLSLTLGYLSRWERVAGSFSRSG
jgi:hypothetical protein